MTASEGSAMAALRPTLETGLESRVRVGLVQAAPVAVGPASEALLTAMTDLAAELKARYSGLQPSAIPALAPARDLYKAFGIDPTRTRPSSEALLRRVLQDKPLPRILNAVDLCNLVSLRTLLPIGLYDLGRIRGAVSLRRGRPGEAFAGIRKEEIHVEGRIVLADDEGPFGNPSSDSLRTSVTEECRALWMVLFAPAAYSATLLSAQVGQAAADARRYLSPQGIDTEVLTGLFP